MESSLTQRNWWAFCFQCLCRIVLILHIRKEVEEGNLPADVASSLEELYYNYKNAVKTAGFDLCSIFNVLLSDCCSSCLAIFCYQVAQTGYANAYEIMLSNMMYRFCLLFLFLFSFTICSGNFVHVPIWSPLSSFILCRIHLPRTIRLLQKNDLLWFPYIFSDLISYAQELLHLQHFPFPWHGREAPPAGWFI